MPLAVLERSVLVVVDLQPTFLGGIHRKERILSRCAFLIRAATALGVPVLATEQYPARMGGTDSGIKELLDAAQAPIYPKMAFSCAGCEQFSDRMRELGRDQAVIAGIETHICVNQTAHHLLDDPHEVFVPGDAVGARTDEMHKIGLKRMRAAGATIAHSESIVYEWMLSAEHPQFREVLKLVKEHAE
jgi:nicotinamidase-related amidase